MKVKQPRMKVENVNSFLEKCKIFSAIIRKQKFALAAKGCWIRDIKRHSFYEDWNGEKCRFHV